MGQTVIDKLKTVNHDTVIEGGIVFLLIFTPLAMGAVQEWAVAVMELVAFVVFLVWLLKSIHDPTAAPGANRTPGFHPLTKRLLFFFLVLVGIVILQIVPLPAFVLDLLSPKSAAFYRTFADDAPGAWRTISISRGATVNELFKLLSYAFVFIVIINHYDAEAKIRRLFRTVLYMGCFLAVFAVVQKMTSNGKLFWIYPLRDGLNPTGPYINKNHFAGYMEMAAPVGMGFFLYTVAKMKWMSNLSGVRFSKRLALFLDNENLTTVSFGLVAVMIMTGALFLTLSRGAIAGALASMIFFASLARSRRSLRKKWNYIVLIGMLVSVVIIAASWSMVEARFENAAGGGTFKRDVWSDAAVMARDYPVLGAGFGTFSRIFPAYQTGRPQWFFDHAENDYLEMLTETGLLGFTACTCGMAFFFYSLYKRWRERHNTYVICAAAGGMASMVAIAVHSMVDFNMHIPANALLLTIIAAATCATVFNIKSQHHLRDASKQQQLH